MLAVDSPADRQCTVFDHFQVVAIRDFHNRWHVTRDALKMHDGNRPGSFADGSLNGGGRQIAGQWIRIDEDRSCSDPFDGMHRRGVGHGGHNHFIAGADSKVQIGKVQRRHA